MGAISSVTCSYIYCAIRCLCSFAQYKMENNTFKYHSTSTSKIYYFSKLTLLLFTSWLSDIYIEIFKKATSRETQTLHSCLPFPFSLNIYNSFMFSVQV